VDQKSGVSVRVTRAAMEDLISAAERRALLNGEDETTARVSDLMHTAPAITGKVELVYEGEEEGAENVAYTLVGRAVRAVFKKYFPDPADKHEGRPAYKEVMSWFSKGNELDLSQDLSFSDYTKRLDAVEGLKALAEKHTSPDGPAETASTMELIVEALHQNSLVGKELGAGASTYSDIMGSVLSSLGGDGGGPGGGSDDDDDLDDLRRRYG
jgi:magnesium chelatase subunit I